MSIEDIEKKRAELRVEHKKKEAEQREKDLEALLDLEIEHGCDRVRHIDTGRFVEGIATLVVLKSPTPVAHKRFIQEVQAANGKKDKLLEAQDRYASVCWLYPSEDEDKKKIREEFPELLSAIAAVAADLSNLRKSEEGKG